MSYGEVWVNGLLFILAFHPPERWQSHDGRIEIQPYPHPTTGMPGFVIVINERMQNRWFRLARDAMQASSTMVNVHPFLKHPAAREHGLIRYVGARMSRDMDELAAIRARERELVRSIESGERLVRHYHGAALDAVPVPPPSPAPRRRSGYRLPPGHSLRPTKSGKFELLIDGRIEGVFDSKADAHAYLRED